MIQLALTTVAILLLAFAISVWKASPDRVTNRRFTTFTITVALWALGVATTYGGHLHNFWSKFTFASASLMPAALLLLITSFKPLLQWPSPIILRCTVVAALVFAFLAVTTSLIVYDPGLLQNGVTRKAGVGYPLFAAYVVATCGTAFLLLAAKLHRARGVERAQLQYVGAGIIIPGAGAVVSNLLLPLFTGRSTYGWVGPLLALAFVAIVGHAIIRHRLIDLRLVVHRGLTLAAASILSLVHVAVLIMIFWPRLVPFLESDDLLWLLAALVAVALLVPPTRDLSQRLLDRYVYRAQANYRRTVREASDMLTRLLNLGDLLPFISHTIVTSTSTEGVAIYLHGDDGFVLVEARHGHTGGHFEAPSTPAPEVLAALLRAKEPVLTDEVARDRPTPEVQALLEQLTRTNWSLLLPVLSEDVVIALIAVGPKMSGDPFYPQDLDLLMTLANQAGIAIKNGQLYAQVVLANEYIENIVATIESGVIATTASGRITMFNPAAERLTGFAAAAVKGQAWNMLPACLHEALGDAVHRNAARTQPEIVLPCVGSASAQPSSRPVICTTSPLRAPTGAVLGAVTVFSDLTPLKELEIERRRAERLAYFEVLAAAIAHEIKNPLVAVKTFGQLLPRRLTDKAFVDEFGRVVTREVARVERLVERLRTLARPGERPRHPIDIRGPLADALGTLRATFDEKSVSVTVTLTADPCMILGDASELEQLFLNLLMNAHEATAPGGTVSVDAVHAETHVTVTVADTGPGIAPELLERVFEPFFTTKQRGSGLGLAICAGIAQTHGARLRAANRASGGAVFTIDFPLVTVPASVTT